MSAFGVTIKVLEEGIVRDEADGMRWIVAIVTDDATGETAEFTARDIFDFGWTVNPNYAIAEGKEPGGLLDGEWWMEFHSDEVERKALKDALPRQANGLPIGWRMVETDKRYSLKDVRSYRENGTCDMSRLIVDQIEGDDRGYLRHRLVPGSHRFEVSDSSGEVVAGAPTEGKALLLAERAIGRTDDTEAATAPTKRSGWYRVREATDFEKRAINAMSAIGPDGVRM